MIAARIPEKPWLGGMYLSIVLRYMIEVADMIKGRIPNINGTQSFVILGLSSKKKIIDTNIKYTIKFPLKCPISE
jgi:hypothetical protein